MNHPVAPTVTWTCPACKLNREVEYQHIGSGIPACPVCQAPMECQSSVRQPETLPPVVEAIKQLQNQNDPDLVGECDEQ